MDQEELNKAIVEEINHEIQVDLDDFDQLEKTIAADKANDDEENAAYHTGMRVYASANIYAMRDMLKRIQCMMENEPIPDMLQWRP